jgi:dihydrolipoamide dehydrogenase
MKMASAVIDVVVMGAGPAGTVAAMRAAELGARTVLVARDSFGGMATNDGPVPVRTLAHAARLMRDARQLGQYGITLGELKLDYTRLLQRVGDVVADVRTHLSLREQIDSCGVTLLERTGAGRFIDTHTIETSSGLRLRADRFIICTGGINRRLSIPGFELTSTHSDAWGLTCIPQSMLVIGGGATGVQVASIFNAFGTRVQLFEAAPRMLMTEDDDIAAAVRTAFHRAGIEVHENFGTINSFEKTATGVRMNITSKDGRPAGVEATLIVSAAGWAADTVGLNLNAAGVAINQRGFVQVDDFMRTTAPQIFAAGDIVGRMMLVPQALQEGFVAATNAVQGATTLPVQCRVNPVGSFTDPEYAQAGLGEKKAKETYDVVTAIVRFDSTTRTIIDGHTFGFCKLIVDRKRCTILGCHVVGERAVDIVQVAAIAIAADMRVDDLARVPLSFPTYAGILVNAAADAARQLNLDTSDQTGPPATPDRLHVMTAAPAALRAAR